MKSDSWPLRHTLRWLTLSGISALLFGIAALLATATAEVLGTPGSSLVDGYWRGRLPWIEFGVVPIVIGSSVAAVLGLLSAWATGGWLRRIIVVPAFLLIAFWWLLAMQPPLMGAPCVPQPCPLSPADPWANAYSSPEQAAIFLIGPSIFIAALALLPGLPHRMSVTEQ